MADELDLSGLEDWPDDDVIGALEDMEDGLTDNQLTWIGRFREGLDDYGELSPRMREVAEDILRQANVKRARSIDY